MSTGGNSISKIKKKEIKFDVQLSKDQLIAYNGLFKNDVVTIRGKAGSGKGLVSAYYALEQIFLKEKRKIYITRPTVSDEELGYLPGPQPLYSKVLTPTGWTTMGELRKGDLVIGRDGKSYPILETFDKGIKKIYEIQTVDGCKVRSSDDHVWSTYTRNKARFRLKRELVTTRQIKDTLKLANGKLNHMLPRNEAIQYSKKDLLIPPYLLGALLGDGSICDGMVFSNIDQEIIDRVEEECREINCQMNPNPSFPINHQITGTYHNNDKPSKRIKVENIHTSEVVIYDQNKEFEEKTGISISRVRHHSNDNDYIFDGIYKCELIPCEYRWSNILKDKIYQLGLLGKKSNDKFIPDVYLRSTVQDRLDLLRGMMDTDGSVNKHKSKSHVNHNGCAEYYTCSPFLAEGVIELVRSLGGKASLMKRKKRYSTLTKTVGNFEPLSVYIRLPEDMNPFYVPRKANIYKSKYIRNDRIKDVIYIGEERCKCILIDSNEHLYITDDFIVTHNTLEAKLNPWLQPIYQNFEACYSSGEHQKKALKKLYDDNIVEIVPIAFMRGRTFTNAIIIVDEAQNITKKQMEMVIGRLGHNSQMIICGDMRQLDLDNRKRSGLDVLVKIGEGVKGFQDYVLTSNHRHSILDELLTKFEEFDENEENEKEGKYKITIKKSKPTNIFESEYEVIDENDV